MSDETYNGWKNYETWATHLWLTNDEGSYSMCVRTAGDAIRHSETPRVYLADALRELVTDEAPELPASLFSDLLGSALERVDWFEVADAFLEDEGLEETKRLVKLGY